MFVNCADFRADTHNNTADQTMRTGLASGLVAHAIAQPTRRDSPTGRRTITGTMDKLSDFQRAALASGLKVTESVRDEPEAAQSEG